MYGLAAPLKALMNRLLDLLCKLVGVFSTWVLQNSPKKAKPDIDFINPWSAHIQTQPCLSIFLSWDGEAFVCVRNELAPNAPFKKKILPSSLPLVIASVANPRAPVVVHRQRSQ
jgi:hypothetical protein